MKKCNIDISNYERLKQIGYGAFGNVYEAKNTKTGKICAAKVLKFSISDEKKSKKSLSRELSCHKHLKSPAIIQFIGYSDKDFDGSDCPVIFTKYMKNGCLFNMFNDIRKKKPKGWNNTKMVINILGIALGIKHLHDNEIIHRDLKPSNILLDSDLYPKITDFGTARHLDKKVAKLTMHVGTPQYMAPEVGTEEPYSYEADVFSFGMILYEFYTGKTPTVPGGNAFLIIQNISNGIRPDDKIIPDGPVKELITKCWSDSPIDRPALDDIILNYTAYKDDFWPEDVDEDEVDQYLSKYGLSLNPDSIPTFLIDSMSSSSEIADEEEEEEDKDADIDPPKKKKTDTKKKSTKIEKEISSTTSVKELKSILLSTIEDMDTPEEYQETELDEDDLISRLKNPYKNYLIQARDKDEIKKCIYVSNAFRKGTKPYPEDKYYAFKYMKKAALLGSPIALYGFAFFLKPDFKKDDDEDRAENFIDALKIAVEFGSERASYVFGFIYSIGFHVEENFVMALVYLKLSADKKFPPAMLMYADRLRTIVNEKISMKELKDLKKKSIAILNDIRGYNTRTNALRITANNLFDTIKDPKLTDYVSRAYYKKVIDFDKSTDDQKEIAQKKLDKLEDEEYLEDYSSKEYERLFKTFR